MSRLPPTRPRLADGVDVATVANAPAPTLRAPKRCTIVVIEGEDTSKTFVLDPNAPGRILLGTSPACHVRLSDPTVSRRHAAFEPSGQRFRITDLQSTNGTFVDGVAIADAYVNGGEVIRCGSTAMRIEADDAATTPNAPLPDATSFGLTLGSSSAMRRIYPLCERLAKTHVPVIIEGETGTGKEVLAESLHEVGGSRGPFVVFDCTTVSPNLVESELFGHERGSFTGAVGARGRVRGGGRWHPLHRRDRRSRAAAPGQAPPRDRPG